MVEVCRARGLEVAEADVVSYLDALPDGSLGGLLAAQVVEHFQPGYLMRFLELAFHKLRPGAPIVLETLNPACWTAFFDSFIRDITHVWPLHPDTLNYLVLASGFSAARIEYRSPVAAQDRLQPLLLPGGGAAAGEAVADLAEAFNANVEKLNARMFTFLDYAIVGRR
jgi:O-antigen chain-terminating methyltransferase